MKGFGGFNVNNMLKQVQKMQSDMAKMQEEMAERTVESTSGGGMVRVVVNGKQELKSIEINPQVVDPDDVEMLQDLIMAAINEGIRKSQEMVAEEMSKLTGGIKIPGLF